MTNRTIEQHTGFIVYKSEIHNEQTFITVAITENTPDAVKTAAQVFNRIAAIISEEKLQIFQERIFGETALFPQIQDVRQAAYEKKQVDSDLQATFIEGIPAWGSGIAGVQIRAISMSSDDDRLWTIFENDTACGRGWKRNGATYLFFQNMHGYKNGNGTDNSRMAQTERMFERTDSLLQQQGVGYRNVVRTWIYLHEILDWYGEFNQVRNEKYKNYKIITNNSNPNTDYEAIPLPASTGILASNPINAAAVMDALAIVPETDATVEIKQVTGIKQRSPYRYGSAFSRAMSVREPEHTTIFLSGTAAIDEKGNSVFPGDTKAQIKKTLEVVDALIEDEGATVKDICNATVFLKRAEDLPIYYETIRELGLEGLPAVCVVADVCRDDLLFEIDATIIAEK